MKASSFHCMCVCDCLSRINSISKSSAVFLAHFGATPTEKTSECDFCG